MNEQLVATEEHDGFTIRFYACEEDISPYGHFTNEDGSDDTETIGKIEDGTYVWFCAKVTASKAGVELADDYLGACCYESCDAFWSERDGYAGDMIRNVITEAREIIAKLCV